MKKITITIICVLVIIIGMISAILLSKSKKKNDNETIVTEISKEEILDECTDEYEKMEIEDIEETNSNQEKISPNCSIIQKTYYNQCGHTKSENIGLPQELVNATKEEIQKKYSDYKIEKFARDEIILEKEKEGQCEEHYIVKDKEGTVIIYQILEDKSQKEYEITGITTEYLPETDKINMNNGIEVIGKQELNRLIENFE